MPFLTKLKAKANSVFWVGFLLARTLSAGAQAPDIRYNTPNVYRPNIAIPNLVPSNTGGPVPATVYSTVSTFAGNGTIGHDDGQGQQAQFIEPNGMDKDAAGNIYLADQDNNRIRKITPGGLVSTYAGNGLPDNVNGFGNTVSFSGPRDIAIDADGNMFVVAVYSNVVRRIDAVTGEVTDFAGRGPAGFADGPANTATFNGPTGIAIDAAGLLYVTDGGNNMIRTISKTGYVYTLAGARQFGTNDGPGNIARFNVPVGITAGPDGNMYVTESNNRLIRQVAPNGFVTTVAGDGTFGFADGPAFSAKFGYPNGITFDASGNIIVADMGNNRIRKITPAGIVSTLAGNGSFTPVNGLGKDAQFNLPAGVVIVDGNLYVSEYNNNLVRKIILTGYTIDKPLPAGLVFDPKTGFISGTPTQLSPATDYEITAYNKDGSSSTIVSIEIVNAVILPAVITFRPITNKNICDVDFSVNATSTNTITPLTYASSNPAVATVSATGMVHITGSGTTTITVSQAGSGAFDPALPVSQSLTVIVQAIPVVTIAPDFGTGCEGMTITFTATSSLPNVNYQWQINGIDRGANSPTLAITVLSKTDMVKCTVTTTGACPVSAGSAPFTGVGLEPYKTPGANILSSATWPVCSGTQITFTAFTDNEGAAPVYQWIVNNVNTGTNSKTFTSSALNNGDVVTFMLTNTGGACLTTLYAYSDPITVQFFALPSPAPSVSITPSANGVYAGTVITFTAVAQNAGISPKYQWKVNGVNAGANLSTFTTSNLNDLDKVTCAITVNINCTYEVTSAGLTVNILSPVNIAPVNAFTPNSDGVNDSWAIANLVNYPACKIYVYNRAGKLVMESKGYNKAWDGTYQGRLVPAGVYYYIIDLKNGSKSITGNLTVLR